VLILTRRVGESIVVGDDIVLTVFEVRGDAVRVGIEAPRSVQVHRQEVYDELKRLNEQSVSPSDDAVDALREALGTPASTEPAADETVPEGRSNAGAHDDRPERSVAADPAEPPPPPPPTAPRQSRAAKPGPPRAGR
jgi:carbon storage regulator